ncbi:hypothetical protein [Flagellimonas marinaquae]
MMHLHIMLTQVQTLLEPTRPKVGTALMEINKLIWQTVNCPDKKDNGTPEESNPKIEAFPIQEPGTPNIKIKPSMETSTNYLQDFVLAEQRTKVRSPMKKYEK